MIKITKVTNLGNDLLEVRGFDDTNPTVELIGQGWISATTNYYPPDQYGENGNLLDKAKPREMNEKEKRNYWISLLKESIPQVENKDPDVLFEDKEAQEKMTSEIEKSTAQANN